MRSYDEYKHALSTSGSYTPIGHAHYNNSRRRILGDISALEMEMTDQRGTPHGVLRVTTSLTFSTHQLAPMIGEFLQLAQLMNSDG